MRGENGGGGEKAEGKKAQDDRLKAHPPVSPLNGGIYKMGFTGLILTYLKFFS